MASILESEAEEIAATKGLGRIPIVTVAAPEASEKSGYQLTLLCLPIELRHKIYRFALTESEPFVDPCISSHSGPTIISPDNKVPSLGIGLLRTCRQIHTEATALACLYRENIFQFTTVVHCHKFFNLLGLDRASQIQILSINLRLVAQGCAAIAGEWLSYTSEAARSGLWIQRRLGSLKYDVPNLKCVHLDLHGWCKEGFGEHRWEYLRSLLKDLRDLECISVDGEVKIRNLTLAVSKPWAPELFVTNEVFDHSKAVGYGGTMIDLMTPGIRCDDQDEMVQKKFKILWSIAHGNLTLELSTQSRVAKRLSVMDFSEGTAPLPNSYRCCRGKLSSSCMWERYRKRADAERT